MLVSYHFLNHFLCSYCHWMIFLLPMTLIEWYAGDWSVNLHSDYLHPTNGHFTVLHLYKDHYFQRHLKFSMLKFFPISTLHLLWHPPRPLPRQYCSYNFPRFVTNGTTLYLTLKPEISETRFFLLNLYPEAIIIPYQSYSQNTYAQSLSGLLLMLSPLLEMSNVVHL